MCFGTIEVLPLEIFETIVSYLRIGDEARLYSTCRHLHIYGEPLLLDPFERRQRAMLWAVRRDDLALLKRCVRAGAPLHVVTVFKTKEALSSAYNRGMRVRPRICCPKLLSTLVLAVRSESLHVFEHLCAQGVGFKGHPAVRAQSPAACAHEEARQPGPSRQAPSTHGARFRCQGRCAHKPRHGLAAVPRHCGPALPRSSCSSSSTPAQTSTRRTSTATSAASRRWQPPS